MKANVHVKLPCRADDLVYYSGLKPNLTQQI